MKRLQLVMLTTLLLGAVVFMMTILDLAALRDIRQDYVSGHIIGYLGVTLSEELPEWTSTTGEWRIVTINIVLRFVFVIFSLAVSGCYLRNNIRDSAGQ